MRFFQKFSLRLLCLHLIFLTCHYFLPLTLAAEGKATLESQEGVIDINEFDEGSAGKNRVKRADAEATAGGAGGGAVVGGKNVTIESLMAELAQAKKDISQLKAEFGLADEELDLFLQNINSTLNFDFAVNTAKARLYSEKNHMGLSEDYNLAEDYYGVGCQNLSGLLARVRSIDPFDSCVRIFSRADCHGHTIVFYPGSLYHGDVERIFSDGVKSIGPCFSQPYGKRYPDDLYDGIVKNEDNTRKMQQQIETLKQQVNDQQILLEQLSLNQNGGQRAPNFEIISFDNDTVSPTEDSPDVWNTCGGLLTLSTSRELSHKNLGGNLSQSEETCVWLIWARNGGPIVVTLSELWNPPDTTNQTNDSNGSSSSSNATRGQLSLHFISQSATSTIVQKIDLVEIGKEYGVNDSTILIIFKSTAAAHPEAPTGFTLRARDLARNRRNRDFRIAANFLKPHPLHPATHVTFTHPTFHGQEYLSLERRHIFIQPLVGKRIHLQIDFVYTEEVLDSLDVFRFSRKEQKFLFLQSYSGRWRRLTHEEFVGDESEPMFLYFDSDASIEDLGFQISYHYSWANETTGSSGQSLVTSNRTTNIRFDDYGDYDDFENVSIQPQNQGGSFENCGGLVPIPEFVEISFKNSNQTNATNGGKNGVTCVWLIWGKYGGPVALTLEEFNYSSSSNDSGSPKLSIQDGLSVEGSTRARLLTEQNIGNETIEISLEPYTLLVFTSTGGGQYEGFRLKFRDLRQLHSLTRIVDLTLIGCDNKNDNEATLTYSYPPKRNDSSSQFGQYYVAQERKFFVVSPPSQNEKVNLTFNFIDTEPAVDLIRVYKFSVGDNNFQFFGRFSGRFDSDVDSGSFLGNVNQPMLLYFMSDSSGHGSGFQISYSCQNDSQKIEKEKNEELPTFGTCGGHIVLTNETHLAYKNEGNRSAEGDDEETCMWLISCHDDGVIGVTMVAENFTSNTVLSLQSGFNTLNSSTISRPITKNSEFILEKPYALLVFSSQTGDQFHLKLRQLGKTRWSPEEARDDQKEVTLSTFRLASGDSDTYAYPGDDWSTYKDHERRFVVLEPAQNEQMTFSIKFIDTETNYDYLSLFKWSKWSGHFLFVQKFTGDANDLQSSWSSRGFTNEPMLAYFHSDGSKPGHGFRFSYSSQMVTNGSGGVDDGSTNFGGGGPATTIRQLTCGALIPVDGGQIELVYKNGAIRSQFGVDDNEETCVFILWAKRGGPFEVTLIDLTLFEEGGDDNNNNNNQTSNSKWPTLSLQRRFDEQRSSIGHLLKIEDKNVPVKINQTNLLLVFTSTPGQSFRLGLRDLGETSPIRNLKVSANFLAKRMSGEPDDPTLFAYPHTRGRRYLSMERRHVVLKSYPGFRVQFSLDFFNTETSMRRATSWDFLTIFKFYKEENKFLYLRRFSGSSNQLRSSPIFQGLDNQPLLIYFHSAVIIVDGSTPDCGFRIFYSYHKINTNDIDMDTDMMTTTRPPNFELTTKFVENFENEEPTDSEKSSGNGKDRQTISTKTPSNFHQTTSADDESVMDSRFAEALTRHEDEMRKKYGIEEGQRISQGVIVLFIWLASLSFLTSLIICGAFLWRMTRRNRRAGGQFFGNFINYSRMMSGSENILLETHQGTNDGGVLDER